MQYDPWGSLGHPERSDASWLSSFTDFVTRIMGLFFFASMLQSHSYQVDTFGLFMFGTIIETVRRLCQWLMERYRFEYSMTAQFTEGDPAYEWIILLLTQENLWKRSRRFRVTAASSRRTWGIRQNSQIPPQIVESTIAEYVPTFDAPQLFQWKGYWVEIKRSQGPYVFNPGLGSQSSATMFLTIFTRDMTAIKSFVEDARCRYLETSRPNVVVHIAEQLNPYGPFNWSCTKNKVRRPLSSIILPEGLLDSIVRDARKILDSKDWYIKVGIPHRRGYLLHGPPGTGKSSTIYALAGELGLEIYSISLASGFVNDSVLQQAVAAIPEGSIFLLEDIDCAFPPREDADDPSIASPYSAMMIPGARNPKSNVTLSGLLNVLDGVGSEEGNLFFATTNFIDHLDPAILRPGRIDLKIEYKLATKQQATALFNRFYPEAHTTLKSNEDLSSAEKYILAIQALADKFGEGVPEYEFSIAELQGYLLTCRQEPEQAVEGISAWVLKEQKEREDQAVRVAERKAKIAEARDKRDAGQLQSSWARFGIPMPLTSAVGQQPLGPIMGPTAIPNPAAIEAGPVVAPVLPQPAHLPVATTDDVPRMTDSGPVTPPQTPSNLATQS